MRGFGSTALLTILLAVPAAAADIPARMPVKAPAPAAVVAAYNWSGFYIGGHGGGVWSEDEGTNVTATALVAAGTVNTSDYNGALAGGQAGFNIQSGMFVFGIEGEWSWTNEDGSVTSAALIPGFSVRGSSETKWYATVAGRLGIAANNLLFYVKGGGAWKDVDYTAEALFAGVVIANGAVSDTRQGWLVGGGIEWGITQNWSAKIEYNYLDFGTERYIVTTALGPSTLDVDSRSHIVKAGLNYRFNWGGPVVARY